MTLTGDAPMWSAYAARRAENGHKKGSVGHPTRFGLGQSYGLHPPVASECSPPNPSALKSALFWNVKPST